MEVATENSHERRRFSPLPWIAIALCAYVLLLGPIELAMRQSYIRGSARGVVHTIYAPLGWVYWNVPGVHQVLDWYLALWQLS